jgi:hypothetical protein
VNGATPLDPRLLALLLRSPGASRPLRLVLALDRVVEGYVGPFVDRILSVFVAVLASGSGPYE